MRTQLVMRMQLALLLLFCFGRCLGEVPHRRLATEKFPGPAGLNSPMGAYLPKAGQLLQLLELKRLVSRKARARGINLEGASPEFFQDVIRELQATDPDLLASIPDLARTLRKNRTPQEIASRFSAVTNLAEALKDSELKLPLQKFLLKGALRAQREPERSTFKETVKKFKSFLEKAGLSGTRKKVLKNIYTSLRNRSKAALARLRNLAGTRNEQMETGFSARLLIPFGLLVFTGFCAWLLFLFTQRRTKKRSPPALPKTGAQRIEPFNFARALLSFYRRALFDCGKEFRGKTLSELRKESSACFPGIARPTLILNEAFYRIWYGNAKLSRDKLKRLNSILIQACRCLHSKGKGRAEL